MTGKEIFSFFSLVQLEDTISHRLALCSVFKLSIIKSMPSQPCQIPPAHRLNPLNPILLELLWAEVNQYWTYINVNVVRMISLGHQNDTYNILFINIRTLSYRFDSLQGQVCCKGLMSRLNTSQQKAAYEVAAWGECLRPCLQGFTLVMLFSL